MALFNPANFSTAEQIADVVYEAATDGKNQLRYVAGEDANPCTRNVKNSATKSSE